MLSKGVAPQCSVVTTDVYCVPVQAKQKTGMWKQFENFAPPVKKKERTHFVVELGPGYRSVQYSTVQYSTVQYSCASESATGNHQQST